GRVGATAHGIPKPTPRSDFPPSAACGAFAPSVTRVPAGNGQAGAPPGQGYFALPGPSRGIGWPPTKTGVPVASVTTGLIAVRRGSCWTSPVPRKTPGLPFAFRAAATALYLAVKRASGVAVTPSRRNPAPGAVRMSLPTIVIVMKVGFRESAWFSADPLPRSTTSARPPDVVSETSAILNPGTERLS